MNNVWDVVVTFLWKIKGGRKNCHLFDHTDSGKLGKKEDIAEASDHGKLLVLGK